MSTSRRNKANKLTDKQVEGVKTIAKTVVKKAINKVVETKFYQYRTSYAPGTVVQWSGAMCDIASGSLNGQRTGDKILPKKIKIRMALTAGDATNFIRCLFVRFRDNDSGTIGSPFDADKVLAPGATGNIDWTSQYLYSNKKNYDILFDKVWTMVQQSDTHVRTFEKIITLGKTNIVYNPNVLTGSGRYFFIFLSDSAIPGHPNLDWTSTFFYQDA